MRSLALALLFVLLAGARGVLEARADPEPAGTYVVECSFSHPAYSGRCGVSETTPRSTPPKEACEAILSCLNDSRCSGKTYCNATTLRGGWKLEEAKEKGD
jgi:hypothetical protein